ncbi:B-cell linker protein isoform X3 [Alligator mississippiensis]|uniref:B-cell linker protein isoform X3 n=1 Tax=Alligator mississippiensis TaxID=8496 RepID=UPI0009070006|nr:B-cell linker protein isoform X3 [Alligator mississippiensis]
MGVFAGRQRIQETALLTYLESTPIYACGKCFNLHWIKSSSLDTDMATKLPTREECENWITPQVADLLRQFGMPESAVVVEKLNINGPQFLNITDYELKRFNIMHQPKLQKMVHDIKKNETGIMSKFKKLTNKPPPPSVPQRDYASEHADEEEEQWPDDFDSDYENPDDHSDSEMYVVPSEENGDDSYEPPPTEQEKKKIPSAFPISRGEYAGKVSSQTTAIAGTVWEGDNRTSLQPPPPIIKPLPSTPSQSLSKPKKPSKPAVPSPSAAPKPKVPPKRNERVDDEDDYVVPVDDEDDNYIEPTESSSSPSPKPPVNRYMKSTTKPVPIPAKPSPASAIQEVYEIPEEEEKPSPPMNRVTKPLPSKPSSNAKHPHTHSIAKEPPQLDTSRPVVPVPRNRHQQKAERDRYDAHDNDESHSSSGAQESKFPSGAAPSPLPRAIKKPPNPVIPSKPSLPPRDNLIVNEEVSTVERRRGSTQEIPLPPLPGAQKPLPQKPPTLPKVPDTGSRIVGTPPRSSLSAGLNTADQDAGVHSKTWYAADCDRKTAEDALYRSNKDGSFLIRKSSGQDSKQPYTLVVFYNKRVYNIPVRFIESTKQYALGREKNGEERFDSVAEIIENHQRTSLVLIDSQNNTKDSTKLRHIVRVS